MRREVERWIYMVWCERVWEGVKYCQRKGGKQKRKHKHQFMNFPCPFFPPKRLIYLCCRGKFFLKVDLVDWYYSRFGIKKNKKNSEKSGE